MSLFVLDVESDGPAPGIYSMVCFAAIRVDRGLTENFYGKVRPISDLYIPDALAVSGFSREDHLSFEDPKQVMDQFASWLQKVNVPNTKMTFVSDNPAFDWQFINWYFIKYQGKNPFGHSARRIGDFCAGLKGNWGASSEFKKLRGAKHTHDPRDDALGNAQALIRLADIHKVPLPGVNRPQSAPESSLSGSITKGMR